ncbi:MAG TPA: IS200/IS605 family transposase [Thermoanaerobaculia bacterium]|nr:IS200/IS605 family transposase [Chthoniobacterales bacterium]HVT02347.1 IS200/IS605 family transposase [Thermoanaerobaculia bacterium]
MHSYTAILYHITFATFDRRPAITSQFRNRLHGYLGGTANNLDAKALEIGGVADHVHLMVEGGPTLAVADLVGKLKSNSSRWLHDTSLAPGFDWQRGYGAFSISRSDVPSVGRYIRDQENHHRTLTFEEELRSLLRENEIAIDERYFLK